MLSTFEILLPVFALIFVGFLCRKRGVMGPNAASELNRFVVWLALPALLFDIMAHATWAELYKPALLGVFLIAGIGVYLTVLIVRVCSGRHLADASIDAIAASYPNTGYIGFPLTFIVFGTASLLPTTIATIVVACVLFAIAIAVIEVGVQTERAPLKLVKKVLVSLAKNPLIFSPIAGGLLAATHIALPHSAETFLKLLSAAASPCALVSLGLFLAEKRPSAGLQPMSIVLSVIKLIGQPALTWWLAAHVFSLPTDMVDMVVILVALPTGTGPFMLAEFYRREAVVTSQTILLTTVSSLVSLTILLMMMSRSIH